MEDFVIGIDPGLRGAVVVLDVKTSECVLKEPLQMEMIELYRQFARLHRSYKNVFVACEKPQTVPKQNAKGAFTMGRNFGALEMVLKLLYFAVQYVPPVTWQAELHKGTDGTTAKDKSLCVAKNLWPKETFTFSDKDRRPHDGIYDAMLVAEFIRRRIKR